MALKRYTDPPDCTQTDLLWYTDGSMKSGPVWELRRTGCAILVVSAAGDLVAFGNAVPPPWVRTAAASEVWALMLVLTVAIAPPPILTDCLSLLSAAACGSASVTRPPLPLAHLWSRIAALLDGDVSVLATSALLTWIPAHGGSASTIGNLVIAIDCRANRLADGLAKAAAGHDMICVTAGRMLHTAEGVVRHECAVLGATTCAAKHHLVNVIGEDAPLHSDRSRFH